jgi:hypothetical protein
MTSVGIIGQDGQYIVYGKSVRQPDRQNSLELTLQLDGS